MLSDPKSLDLTAFPEELRGAVAGVVAGVLAERDATVCEVSTSSVQNANLQRDNADLMESNAALSTQNAELEAVNARLEHMVKELHQLVYGKRSEKLSPDERQLAFEDLEVALAEARRPGTPPWRGLLWDAPVWPALQCNAGGGPGGEPRAVS